MNTNTLSLSANTEKITPLTEVTLGDLWQEAEQLGKVSVDSTWQDPYKVTIRFNRRSGTIVWAEGKNTSILFALEAAIREAREMGAGTPG